MSRLPMRTVSYPTRQRWGEEGEGEAIAPSLVKLSEKNALTLRQRQFWSERYGLVSIPEQRWKSVFLVHRSRRDRRVYPAGRMAREVLVLSQYHR